MSRLAALRGDLDMMPSPVEGRPGLLIRDVFEYAEGALIIPPPLMPSLRCFDGQHTLSDLSAAVAKATGSAEAPEIAGQLARLLGEHGFLLNEDLELRREQRHRLFRESGRREPSHAGSAYPNEPAALRTALHGYVDPAGIAAGSGVAAIAAPHVSPSGGWQSYRAAYQALGPAHSDRTFVILGTSHYGAADRFGLTRKPFVTPLGTTRVASAIVEELARQPAAVMEDYCHAVEHSIEFQVLFLQWLYGPDVRVAPVLCGPFVDGIRGSSSPEDDPGVHAFLETLGEIAAREGDRLCWVLGIDMAHQGRRYGDFFTARAQQQEMQTVEARDRQRIERILAGDADGFWDLVQQNRDDLRWCGASPLYTFLKALPGLAGTLHRYEQWNIDEHSVVSFAALSFERR
ncbi:MAG TPA: AmmeMemoRadiSam system protein B [Solibacterales bacterium]|nr:AmmeMemoRadiSam system protein B [Bryobacterales bacterium]